MDSHHNKGLSTNNFCSCMADSICCWQRSLVRQTWQHSTLCHLSDPKFSQRFAKRQNATPLNLFVHGPKCFQDQAVFNRSAPAKQCRTCQLGLPGPAPCSQSRFPAGTGCQGCWLSSNLGRQGCSASTSSFTILLYDTVVYMVYSLSIIKAKMAYHVV